MTASLKLLVIEDDQADYQLITRHLRRAGLAADCTRVASALELAAALEADPWDAVLADYYLPGMEFLPTLSLIRRQQPHVPVILVSGAVGEERAVELLRLGVGDFVLKDHLLRLVPAIERCLREAADQAARAVAETALRESEERLRLALEGGELGMWDWQVVADSLVVNARWAAMLGARLADIPPTRGAWEARVHPEDLTALREGFAALLAGRAPLFQVDHRLRHQDGHWVWVASRGKVIVRDGEGRPLRVCGTHQDVSERRRLEHELRLLAITDPLTGAYNRRHLMQALEFETRRVQRYHRPLTLIMFDLDDFKAINDTQGHGRGDATLTAVVAQIGVRLRSTDTFARWGGEEFMVLLPETPLDQALTLAESFRVGLHGLSSAGPRRITASFGVAEYLPDETLDQWLKRVDDLVFQAKREGRDRIAGARLEQDPAPLPTAV